MPKWPFPDCGNHTGWLLTTNLVPHNWRAENWSRRELATRALYDFRALEKGHFRANISALRLGRFGSKLAWCNIEYFNHTNHLDRSFFLLLLLVRYLRLSKQVDETVVGWLNPFMSKHFTRTSTKTQKWSPKTYHLLRPTRPKFEYFLNAHIL